MSSDFLSCLSPRVEALEREKSVQLFGAHSQFGKQHGDLQDLDRKTQAECKMESKYDTLTER